MAYDQLTTGDAVFVHMRDDINPDLDGPVFRFGLITRIGTDFFGELMIALDDGNPPIRLADVEDLSNHGQRLAGTP